MIPPRDDRAVPEAVQALSEDIRAAMSDVLGGMRLVDTQRLDAQTQTQIDRVRAASDKLAGLIDDMLLVTSTDAKTASATGLLVSHDWLAAMKARWTAREAGPDCALTIHGQDALPTRMPIAPAVLDEIMDSLIENAVRHGANSAVTLEFVRAETGAVTLALTDSGPGFPDHILHGPARPVSDEGHGLGLHIVRALCAGIGAQVTLANRTMAQGASATVWLPPALCTPKGHQGRPLPLPDLSGLRILVAEDTLTNQTILLQMLLQMGATADFVGDGEAALEALRGRSYDLALIDIEMPRLSGLKVMEEVRSDPGAVARLPMVAITTYVLRDNREAIYAAGADGIIGKPVTSAAEFGRAILRHVGQPLDHRGMSFEADGPDAGLVEADVALLDGLLAAAGPDGSFELLDRVFEDLTKVLAALDTAFAAQDFDEIRGQTHVLISISGALGAGRVCHLAEGLNIAAKRGNMQTLTALFQPMRRALLALINVIAARRGELRR